MSKNIFELKIASKGNSINSNRRGGTPVSARDKTGLVPYMLNHHQQNNSKDDPVNTKGYKCKTLDKYKKKFDRDIRNNKGRYKAYNKRSPVGICKILIVLEQIIPTDSCHHRNSK